MESLLGFCKKKKPSYLRCSSVSTNHLMNGTMIISQSSSLARGRRWKAPNLFGFMAWLCLLNSAEVIHESVVRKPYGSLVEK